MMMRDDFQVTTSFDNRKKSPTTKLCNCRTSPNNDRNTKDKISIELNRWLALRSINSLEKANEKLNYEECDRFHRTLSMICWRWIRWETKNVRSINNRREGQRANEEDNIEYRRSFQQEETVENVHIWIFFVQIRLSSNEEKNRPQYENHRDPFGSVW